MPILLLIAARLPQLNCPCFLTLFFLGFPAQDRSTSKFAAPDNLRRRTFEDPKPLEHFLRSSWQLLPHLVRTFNGFMGFRGESPRPSVNRPWGIFLVFFFRFSLVPMPCVFSEVTARRTRSPSISLVDPDCVPRLSHTPCSTLSCCSRGVRFDWSAGRLSMASPRLLLGPPGIRPTLVPISLATLCTPLPRDPRSAVTTSPRDC